MIHSMYYGCLPIVGMVGAILYVLFLAFNLCTAVWKSFTSSTTDALTPAAAAGLTVLAAVFGYFYEFLNETGLVLAVAGLIGCKHGHRGNGLEFLSRTTAVQFPRNMNRSKLAIASVIGLAALFPSKVSAADTRRPLQDLISAIERSTIISRPVRELVVELDPVTYETTTPWLIDAAFTAIPEDLPIVFKGVPGKTWIVGSKIYKARAVRPDELLPAGLKKDRQLSVIDADSDMQRAWRPQLNRTSFIPGISDLEIFQNGRRFEPARWPDSGYTRSERLLSNDPNSGMFDVPSEKAGEWANSKGLKIGGYFTEDWHYETANISSVDHATHSVRLSPLRSGQNLRPGLRYFVFNSASDLDSDGEYLIDREGGRIFIRGYKDIQPQQEYEVAISAKAMIVRSRKAIRFEGVSFGQTRGDAVQIESSEDVTISDCRVEGTGGSGIVVTGGHRTVIDRCVIRDTGESGVVLSGGNRRTLVPGDHSVRRSVVTNTSVRMRTNTAAVSLDGVGNMADSCYIHSLPHFAVSFSGNDHRIENNEITRVVSETSDAGAIYSPGRDLTWRGNIIRGNYLHDIMPMKEKSIDGESMMDINGVYLDGLLSGTLVKHNIFLRVRNPVFIGGGRDNVVEENLFIEPRLAAIGLNDFGLHNQLSWADLSNPLSELRNKLRAVPTNGPIYASRYPELVHVLDEEPGAPRGNVFISNVVMSGPLSRFSGDAQKYAISRLNSEIPYNLPRLDGLKDIKRLIESDSGLPFPRSIRQNILDQFGKLQKVRTEIDDLLERLH